MYINIIYISNIILLWGCFYISICIPISLYNSIYTCHQWKTSNVHFSSIIKKRTINISLNNISFLLSTIMKFLIFNYLFHRMYICTNLYSITSVSSFTGFYSPNISNFFGFLNRNYLFIKTHSMYIYQNTFNVHLSKHIQLHLEKHIQCTIVFLV